MATNDLRNSRASLTHRLHFGPNVSHEPEKPPEGPSTLNRLLDETNRFARKCIGYGNRAAEKDSDGSEIFIATVRGYAFVAVPIFTGGVATVATNYLAGDGFSVFRCVACFAAAGSMAVADSVILHARMFRRGVRSLRDANAWLKLPSDSDQTPKRIIGLRIAQTGAFGLVVGGAVGLGLNASAIDARLIKDNLVLNHVLVEKAEAEYNAELSRAQTTYDAERTKVERLTKTRGRLSRRTNSALDLESQKLENAKTALDSLQSSHPEFVRHDIEKSPTYIPLSTAPISRVTALGEEFWDHKASAAWTFLLDAIIVSIDTLSLCLGAIGIGGALYPARAARMRLEQLTREARAVAELGGDDKDDPEDHPPASPAADAAMPPQPPRPPVVAANGAAMPRRGRGRPRKDETPPGSQAA